MKIWFKFLCLGAVLSLLPVAAYAAGPIPFTVNLSKAVTVNTSGGTPRIAIDVGGTTRYATYISGSGTSSLVFNYIIQSGDFDANGIALVSPIDANGGSIKDANGNDANLTFIPPNTTGVKIQSYLPAFTTLPITNSNAAAVAFSITGAPTGATYNYSISSSGGAGTVTGTGSITGSPQTVSGVDVSALPNGTLTLGVTITNTSGTGIQKTATATPTFTGVLDSLPASAAAYSVRRLRSAYTGPLLRVRRSSDNTEQDIGGATVGGHLDTAALTSFCGSDSCFVRTWYDQSGNARDATQTTVANQLPIVNSGIIQRSGNNNRVAINCNSTAYAQAAGVMPVNADYTKNAVVLQTSTATYGNVLSGSIGGSTHAFFFANSTKPQLWHTTSFGFGPSIALGSQGIVTGIFTKAGDTGISYSNGTGGSPQVNSTSFADTSIQLCNYKAPSSNGLVGTLAEATVFPSALSITNRQALEANQKEYYGTP